MEKTIYYSVANGGDGSAHPHWYESLELAEWDQDNMEEGWGESCTGSITFSGENLVCVDVVETKEGVYARLKADESPKLESLISSFFTKELPKFKVTIGDKNYYHVLYEGVVVYKAFQHPGKTTEAGSQKWEKYLNE